MTQANDHGAPLMYTVTGQTQTSDYDDTGRIVDGVRVSFRTGAGDSGSVFVPLTAFSVDMVRAAIEARAAAMHAVRNLGGV